MCSVCQKKLYVMERLSAEGLFFHRGCFQCSQCRRTLRLGDYTFNQSTSESSIIFITIIIIRRTSTVGGEPLTLLPGCFREVLLFSTL